MELKLYVKTSMDDEAEIRTFVKSGLASGLGSPTAIGEAKIYVTEEAGTLLVWSWESSPLTENRGTYGQVAREAAVRLEQAGYATEVNARAMEAFAS